MTKYIEEIKNSYLFKGVDNTEIESILCCLEAKEANYAKNQYIIRRGEKLSAIGLLVSGSAIVVQDDLWGNRNILKKIGVSEIFGESLACSVGVETNVSVISEESATVVWLSVSKILGVCQSLCAFHTKIIQNLISEIAVKNLNLTAKINHVCQRTTKEKILAYLTSQAEKSNSRIFTIELNRQQLADYLSVERSALSAELSKLKSQNVIDFDKNSFVIK